MPDTATRRTKIIATLGPATDDPAALGGVLAAGADVLRLNLAHGSGAEAQNRARRARERADGLEREVALLADLQGPKIRIERFADGPVQLGEGQHFVLDVDHPGDQGHAGRVGVSYDGLPHDVAPGDTLLLDDGLITLRVERVEGSEVHCEVAVGGELSDHKGLNRLGGGLSVDALSDKDRHDIALAAGMGVDYLAVSFVGSAHDVNQARELLREAGSEAGVVAKIESAQALDNLREVIDAADAVLVARGDLGVEIGDAELPGLQKRIIREALARNRVVITATQMMQSMVESPIPTRAEVLDVANSVIDGTDAVMLSAETAAGRHPAKAVAAMHRVCVGAERQFQREVERRQEGHYFERTDQAIAAAAMFLANSVDIQAIVALTESGSTAQWLSRIRSSVPIYAMSRHRATRRRVRLFRDVYPVAFEADVSVPNELSWAAACELFSGGTISEGDRVLVTMGDNTGVRGGTNTVKLLRIGADGEPEPESAGPLYGGDSPG